jgi:hypothetical protein
MMSNLLSDSVLKEKLFIFKIKLYMYENYACWAICVILQLFSVVKGKCGVYVWGEMHAARCMRSTCVHDE